MANLTQRSVASQHDAAVGVRNGDSEGRVAGDDVGNRRAALWRQFDAALTVNVDRQALASFIVVFDVVACFASKHERETRTHSMIMGKK